MPEISRRNLLKYGGVVIGAGAVTSALPAGVAAATPGLAAGRGGPGLVPRPGLIARPKFRWWWPNGDVDPGEIAREVGEMADAGFNGGEIASVFDTVHAAIDPATLGWGTPAWDAGVARALATARQRGVEMDLTIGPHWPCVMPDVVPDSPGAAKELAWGDATVAGGSTFSGPVPAANTQPSGIEPGNLTPTVTPHLVALQAARVAAAPSGGPVQLDQSSLVDLTSSVSNGSVTWQAPGGGTWRLIAFWARGTAQIARMYDFNPENSPLTVPQSFVVDHFSPAGVQAVIDAWDARILTPQIRGLLRQAGGAIFEDSLELHTTRHWTLRMGEEFLARRGYPLTPYLALVVVSGTDPAFTFGGDTGTRVNRDYDQTISDLYLGYRVRGLLRWAQSLGLTFRNQGYGLAADTALIMASTGIPEGESLGFGADGWDVWRMVSAGRDLGHRGLLSEEACAVFGGGYDTTWQTMLTILHGSYSVGVNRAVLHGFAYADAPGVTWPGFTPFGGLFANAWGVREPTWRHVPFIAGYLTRTQAVLQAGTARTDVAVYRQDFDITGAPYFADPGLQAAGYTYGFVSHGLLTLPTARVGGRRLDPDGPAYQALILNQQATIPLETARTILSYARAGLPVVVVGDPPAATPGYHDAAARDKAVQAVMAQLLALPSVTRAGAAADVPAALAAAGVTPSFGPAGPTALIAAHRQADGVDYYFLHNPGTTPVSQQASLKGAGVPYLLDGWTAAAEPLLPYTTAPGSVTVTVEVAPGDAVIIAVADGDPLGRGPVGAHPTAVSTGASLSATSGRLLLRAASPGTYTTTFSGGRTLPITIADVGPVLSLTSWDLHVDDWRPGPSATQTTVVPHDLALTSLAPWSDLPGLADASGVGTYRATVRLGATWTGGYGAHLDLGEVDGSFTVTVNGHLIQPDQLTTVVDVGAYLHAGANQISVEVATTLNNRLRVAEPDQGGLFGTTGEYGLRPRMPYGLVGPVRLVPYGQAEVPRR